MVGVSKDRAWPEDHAGAIKNPEFRIRTELVGTPTMSVGAEWAKTGKTVFRL